MQVPPTDARRLTPPGSPRRDAGGVPAEADSPFPHPRLTRPSLVLCAMCEAYIVAPSRSQADIFIIPDRRAVGMNAADA